MKKFRNVLLWTLPFVFLALIAMTFRPVWVSKGNSVEVTGVCQTIQGGSSSYDIHFRIADDNNSYYINRGEENCKLNAEDLLAQMKNKEITLLYAKHWSLLDPKQKVRHITQVKFDGKIIYSEFQNVKWLSS